MDRASIDASLSGKILMSKSAIALVLVAAAACCAPVRAQEAPLRGIGLLALSAARDSDSGLGNAQGLRNVMIEAPDEGGGGELHDARGSGDVHPSGGRRNPAEKTQDELPPSTMPQADPTAPGTAVPKRPTYRWQSLVPGAIK